MLSCSTKFHAILLPVHREICIRATQTPSAPVVLTPEEDGTVSVCVEPEAEAMVLCLLDRPCEIRLTSEVRQHARMRWVLVAVGGPIRVSLSSRCLGADAESSIDGVFLATDNADQRISVQNSFEAPGGEGEITIKGVAQDRACVSVRGMIVIGSSGRGTDTYLTQDVLMLDPTAKVNAVPGLEIRTSDVRASH
jgi:Fe-S cluster assembly scaffold protein SufB